MSCFMQHKSLILQFLRYVYLLNTVWYESSTSVWPLDVSIGVTRSVQAQASEGTGYHRQPVIKANCVWWRNLMGTKGFIRWTKTFDYLRNMIETFSELNKGDIQSEMCIKDVQGIVLNSCGIVRRLYYMGHI